MLAEVLASGSGDKRTLYYPVSSSGQSVSISPWTLSCNFHRVAPWRPEDAFPHSRVHVSRGVQAQKTPVFYEGPQWKLPSICPQEDIILVRVDNKHTYVLLRQMPHYLCLSRLLAIQYRLEKSKTKGGIAVLLERQKHNRLPEKSSNRHAICMCGRVCWGVWVYG